MRGSGSDMIKRYDARNARFHFKTKRTSSGISGNGRFDGVVVEAGRAV